MKNADVNTNAVSEKNIAAVHAMNKAIETGDLSQCSTYIAADAIDHEGLGGDLKGIDSIKDWLGKVHEMAGGNLKIETIKILADDDYVFHWSRPSVVPQAGNPGKWVENDRNITHIHAYKFKDGQAIEHWRFMQVSDVMSMMGK